MLAGVPLPRQPHFTQQEQKLSHKTPLCAPSLRGEVGDLDREARGLLAGLPPALRPFPGSRAEVEVDRRRVGRWDGAGDSGGGGCWPAQNTRRICYVTVCMLQSAHAAELLTCG